MARTAVGDILDAATTLAHHHSKLVRGVTWSGPGALAYVDVARPVAVSTLAAALTAMAGELVAMRSREGIQGQVERTTAEVRIGLTAAALTSAWLTGLAASLRTLTGEGRGLWPAGRHRPARAGAAHEQRRQRRQRAGQLRAPAGAGAASTGQAAPTARSWLLIRFAIPSSGSTALAASRLTASPGMPHTTLESLSCAIV